MLKSRTKRHPEPTVDSSKFLDYIALKRRSDRRWWSFQSMNSKYRQSLADSRGCFLASLYHQFCEGRRSWQLATWSSNVATVEQSTPIQGLQSWPFLMEFHTVQLVSWNLETARTDKSTSGAWDLDDKCLSTIQYTEKHWRKREVTPRIGHI